MLKNQCEGRSEKVPFAGDALVVGRLFASDRLVYNERGLVVLITPYLVAPYDETEQPPLLGGDLFEPSDIEFYLLGRIEGARAIDYRSAVRNDIYKMEAFRRCRQQYIVGPSG